MGCAANNVPEVKIPAAKPAPEATFPRDAITEGTLFSLNLSLHDKCMEGHDGEDKFWQGMCFCTTRFIINKIRDNKIETTRELRRRQKEVIPSQADILVCAEEALNSLVAQD